MRREQNGAAFLGHDANDGLQNVPADHGVQARARFIQDQEVGAVRQSRQQADLGLLPFRKGFDHLRRIQLELLQKLPGILLIPCRIKCLGITHELAYPHPAGQVAPL